MQMRVFILYFHVFSSNFRMGMSVWWCFGDGRPCPLCFEKIPWLHVQRIGIYGYGYIHGYPRKILWIWIWIWMGNEISYPRQACSYQFFVCTECH